MFKNKLVFSVRLAALSFCILGGTVAAQGYPTKPIRIVVPFTAGGGADNMARMLSQSLQKSLGSAVVVDNKPGGRANIGHLAVANAPRDGYTLLLATNSLPINQAAFRDLGFNALTSFVPISLIATSPIVVGVRPGLPVKDAKELLAYGKVKDLTYSSCGVASVYHLVGERINSIGGIKMVHVPYKGCSEALADVVAGNVDVFVNALPNVLPYIRQGTLKAIALIEASRSVLAPDIPTFSESTGIPAVTNQGWYALMAPAGTPGEIVSLLNRSVSQALADPAIKASLKAQVYEGQGGPPQILANLLTSDIQLWSKIISENHLSVE